MPKNTFYNINPEKRKRIINIAIKEFKDSHYENASINNIIKNAGIPKGSFYQYFENKKDLFEYIIGLVRKEKLNYVTERVRNPKEYRFFEVIHDMSNIALTFAENHPELQAISEKLVQDRDHDIYKEILSKNREIALSEYRELIELGITKGELDSNINSYLTAHMIYSYNREIVTFYIENPNFNKEEVINDYVSLLQYGIAK